ncbi:SPOR domain-containing protein [Xanthomonas cannabis]|uniref:SPOR domain-containing protein n=1 Tax=Xanthomonas cannabis TaxID=1885674 RepID=UPI000573352D|nr:SPOR domain-containing protein [Xanthomonas cannabis]KHL59247.1 sporulation protein [Xanthomonas cannabis pv. cannabis]
MYVRALIVVLLILNAGVASWWAVQPPPAPPAAPPQPAGVARLDVLPPRAAAPMPPAQETAAAAADVPPAAAPVPPQTAPTAVMASASTPTPATARPVSAPTDSAVPAKSASTAAKVAPAAAMPPTTPPPNPERCARFGPYAARGDADAALTRLRGQTARANLREDKDAGVSTFRVMLPNVGDRAAAQALVKRIAAAGIGDYYVIAQGEDNTVALGQYQSRERAERRQASLVGAGFPAQLVPSGTGQSRWWIDVRSTATAAALQGAAGATRQRSLDCAALR